MRSGKGMAVQQGRRCVGERLGFHGGGNRREEARTRLVAMGASWEGGGRGDRGPGGAVGRRGGPQGRGRSRVCVRAWCRVVCMRCVAVCVPCVEGLVGGPGCENKKGGEGGCKMLGRWKAKMPGGIRVPGGLAWLGCWPSSVGLLSLSLKTILFLIIIFQKLFRQY